jgi:hypothetical protein
VRSLLLAPFAALLLASAAGSTVERHDVYVVGDSLSVGTLWYLPKYLHGWTVRSDAAISMSTARGISDLEARRGRLEPVLVVNLGTNDDPSATDRFASYVREAVRLAGPSRCLIWSTIYRPPYNGVSYAGLNSVLERLDRVYRNLRVFDWARVAAAHPQWFDSTHVHPNGTGYRVRAALLSRLVRACAG